MIKKVLNRTSSDVTPTGALRRNSVPATVDRSSIIRSTDQLDVSLNELRRGCERYAKTSLQERIRLAESCIDGIVRTAHEWVDAACQAKGISHGSPVRAEEVVAGPILTTRFLRLLIQSLQDIDRNGVPQLPGKVRVGIDGRLRVPVVPVKGLFDQIIFRGFTAHTRMQEGVTRDNLNESLARHYRPSSWHNPRIVLVLGAGNVSGIPVTDMLTKIFQENSVVLLKMHPVNEYLGPIFEQAFAELIDNGFLRIIYGGVDVGSSAISHELVDEVHITGAIESHDTIVWGPAGQQREQRKRENDPLTTKAITSELGNVSPWAIVPGQYTEKQLRFQAENVASSIVNNAAFNCVATRILITSKKWPQRERFLELLQQMLDRIPPRNSYYPGAPERFRRFTGTEPDPIDSHTLPWTLVRDVDPCETSLFFDEESFVCICAETALDAESPQEFLEQAVGFMNERLWGSLCAAITVPPGFRKRDTNEKLLQSCLDQLRYGSVGINTWPGVIYALVSSPWGAYPGSTLADAKSGLGWVHNSYMLENVEKTVLEGPLTIWPKPIWFPTYTDPEPITWKLLKLSQKPSVWNLTEVMLQATPSAIRS